MMPLSPTQPPALPIQTNSGLNGAAPTTWAPNWQTFTDLSATQIAAYQAMPEWQNFVAQFNNWQTNLNSTSGIQVSSGQAPSLTVAYVQSLQPSTSVIITTSIGPSTL